mgnify:CR=1 FL=1
MMTTSDLFAPPSPTAPAKRSNGSAPGGKRNGRNSYDESKVKTLSSLEHIRLRTGMYIGRLGNGSDLDDGIYVLLKEVIDNSIDEFITGNGRKVEVEIEDNRVRVRDFGSGIPLGKLVECVSVINTGAKYNDEVYQFSVGLNGVGTKAVNALSDEFRVVAYRGGQYAEASFARGDLLKETKRGKAPGEPDGTLVEFHPDEQIFGEFDYNIEFVQRRLWNYACLNSGLVLVLNGQKYESKRGLLDLLEREVGTDETKVTYEPAHFRGERLEFAFTHTEGYGETYWSFVNGQYTSDGGTHQSAFREGMLKGVNDFYRKSYGGVDVRDGIAGAVAVKLQEPVFESQTKNKLGNADVRWIVNEVKEAVVDFLHKNREAAERLEQRIINNEKLRKDLNAVKKEAKENARKISYKNPNLRDCKYHLGDRKRGDESTIFITEGQSAAGSIVSSRDPNTQAIFVMTGKPQNAFGRGKAEVYKNELLYNLMMALGVEDGIDGLRYNKVVLATDADVDGFHIRNLLLTFFLTYFEDLVVAGHVYILETPLFRVRNKKDTVYCYSDKEREAALKKVRGAEVTRFKGLGEISPKEFTQFIADDIKLVKVTIDKMSDVPQTLEFYMGKNTPERREYIMANMV